MFFRNRSFNVKMVKDAEPHYEPYAQPAEPIDYDKIIHTIARSAVIVIGAYMGADTARQLIINIVSADL